jgi:hypothetical protein
MAVIPAATDKPLEIRARIEVLITRRQIIEDLGRGVDTGGREACACLRAGPFDARAWEV